MIVDLFAGTYTCISCEGRYGAEEMSQRNKRSQTGKCCSCQRATRRAWYERNTEAAKSYSTAWKRANRDRWLDANRKTKYGIHYGTYAEMLATQGGGCAICGAPEPKDKSLHVDHDHRTGTVRGLLCDLCNRGLGYFADSPLRLAAASRYLTEVAR